VARGSSPQDEQWVQRIGQAKFDFVIEDLPKDHSDEAVKAKGQQGRFRKTRVVETALQSAPVQAMVNDSPHA